jgi:hypothetical protein
MPTADDLDNPEGFVRGEPELDLSFLDAPTEHGKDAGHDENDESGEDGDGKSGGGKGDGA